MYGSHIHSSFWRFTKKKTESANEPLPFPLSPEIIQKEKKPEIILSRAKFHKRPHNFHWSTTSRREINRTCVREHRVTCSININSIHKIKRTSPSSPYPNPNLYLYYNINTRGTLCPPTFDAHIVRLISRQILNSPSEQQKHDDWSATPE